MIRRHFTTQAVFHPTFALSRPFALHNMTPQQQFPARDVAVALRRGRQAALETFPGRGRHATR
jgi:hypothetical protein